MLAIRTILHPTDFSERSLYAMRLAHALARDYGARLVVMHVASRPTITYGEGVIPPDPADWLDAAREQLNALELPEGKAERRLEEGDPGDEIVRVAAEIHADLIVLGTHGRTGLARLLMGSVAEQVVRHAPCPVLTTALPFAPAEQAKAGQLRGEPAGV